ncbi:hypothetical protein TWF730_006642 [Orbilia blumenaviensis]|uniref:Uncharacterized protein n=1 Tax=Orbilia blumenaviensis TaxID=1796055 RepID=A0AAV9VIB5_9PEZI
MRICVLQSAFTSPTPIGEHSPVQDPGKFTDQHTFEHVWVHKRTAKEQIDEAIAKGYDFYFNFMWGQYEDDLAGIDECKYFESFDLPSIGQRSIVLERSKNDFMRLLARQAILVSLVPAWRLIPLLLSTPSSSSPPLAVEVSLFHLSHGVPIVTNWWNALPTSIQKWLLDELWLPFRRACLQLASPRW